MNNELKISVVTVCYNVVGTIEHTMLSVLSQTYDNIEYIIIDGGSTDGTVDIIKKYADRLAYWISEPDKGIYDAMNKGIAVATGDYINFMNAGDLFFSKDVIGRIVGLIPAVYPDAIYGNTYMKFSYGEYIVQPDDLKKITECMTMCHQSVFVRMDNIKKHPFKIEYGLAADHGSLLEIYNDNHNDFLYIDEVIARYDAKDGVSSRNVLKAYQCQTQLTNSKDSLFRKVRILARTYLPLWIQNPVARFFFRFNRRFHRVQ